MCVRYSLAVLLLVLSAALLSIAAPQPAPSAAAARTESSPQRLRGGFEASLPLKPANLGTPNAWSGQNVGPREKRLRFLHAKARPQQKVQSRWYIDCSRPVGDKLMDITDLERFLRENIKVQGKTGNLAAGKDADQPRILIYVEKHARVIMQSYIPVAKRYVKYLIKNYLHKRGLRDFVWCVAAGKASYRLKYYNIPDLKTAAAAPSHSADPTKLVAGEDGLHEQECGSESVGAAAAEEENARIDEEQSPNEG